MVKAYPFVKYSLLSIWRNPRRTFFSIVGVLVAISLIAGEGIAIDSSVGYMIEKELEKIPYEFSGVAEQCLDLPQIENAKNTLNSQANVLESSFIIASNVIACKSSQVNLTEQKDASIFGVDEVYIKHQKNFGISGKIVVGNENATITQDLALALNLSIGDSFFILVDHGFKILNVSSVIVAEGQRLLRNDPDAPSHYAYGGGIYIDINEAIEIFRNHTAHTQVFIWANRSKLIVPSDPEITKFNLKRMERNLNNVLAEYNLSVGYNQEIITAINSVQFTLLGIRFLLGGLSLPLIVLGIYLSNLGSELNYAERRREIGILKARGASDFTIFTILMGEAVFYGVIAGILGLLLGVLASKIFLSSTFGIFGIQPSFLGFSVSALTIGIAIVLAIILSVLASYRAAKQVSKISVREAIQEYTTEEAKIPYNPKMDIIMVVLALITYAAMITISEVGKHPEYYGMQVAISLLCLSAIFIVLVPFSPFFLIIGLSRFITRISPKIYDIVSYIAKPALKDIHQVLLKNLKRNPKRASIVCMLISLALAFGLFVSVTYDSQIAYDAKVLLAEVGADIKVSVYRYGADYPSIHWNLSHIPGVVRYSESFVYIATAGISGVNVCTLNTSTYPEVVQITGEIFSSGNINTLKALRNDAAILAETFAKREGYAPGDVIRITIGNQSKVFKVSGIVKYMPGFGTFPPDVFISDAWFVPGFCSQYLLFLDVNENKIAECADYIRGNYSHEVTVTVYNEELAHQKESPLTGSIYNFLNIEFFFAIAITAIGIAMIMFMAVLERKQEIANMVVRGASFCQIAMLIWGEGITVSFVGVILGLGTGALTAFVFNKLFELVMAGNNVIARDVIFGVSVGMIVGISLVTLFLTTLLVVLPMKKLKLGEILRWRGG
ncbi:MAG: FtsX-like permease family protein [Thermoplasmata archaeon]